jgi:hypothetical protein
MLISSKFTSFLKQQWLHHIILTPPFKTIITQIISVPGRFPETFAQRSSAPSAPMLLVCQIIVGGCDFRVIIFRC